MEDWLKISPFIEDGTFISDQYPVDPQGVVRLHPDCPAEIADYSGRQLYSKILGILSKLFDSFPTSNL